MRIDLHSHSDASDGTRPPAEVVRRAREKGLDVLALTDHDTVSGWDEATRALPDGLTLVPGIELSCNQDGRSLHLLGYLFDPDEPELAAELARIRDDRVIRARGMVDRLRGLGVDVTWGMVRALAKGEAVGRPHIARAMVEAGAIETEDEAFTSRWIAQDGRAYVERYALDPERAVGLVRAAGGVCVLAHPRARRGYAVPDEVIGKLAAAGLAGVEADHPDHAPGDRARLRDLAAGLGLAVTGSSDDHGAPTGDRLGAETTAPDAFEALLAAATGGDLRVPEGGAESR
ncbi:PHP domain-containing protein [Actinomadura madurae]|uniref:PHP domain-containing protein n=1 Tax=Actinomadura madurae TaxID=1993 RepID=UPI0020D24569|nr:PHP domain-containing protein [Actinomadura madurae]MCP9953949.1 PHP domain-containing protein [Actinomadura madurae]MCP9970694.1 PHP domain-containing protein [Actinomadura madurae]MCP9983162.1 PHP domain-containing protein [Actinomadura madurae]MCQ0019415.1 PHP domain-containing protein [Actinomadura madurae]